jgi:hypothetical protein
MGWKIAISIIIILFLFIIINFVIWYSMAHDNFDRRIRAGEMYEFGGKKYQMPNLPIRGKAYLLKEEYMMRQRKLLQEMTVALDTLLGEDEWWVSGGTLLGFTRQGTMLPFDDDLDIHTKWKYRHYLFSKKFGSDLEQFGMQAIYLTGQNLHKALREGAAVRIRFKGDDVPVADIFFCKQQGQKWIKTDGWNGSNVTFSKSEIWDEELLFPVQKTDIDGFPNINMPSQPVNVCKTQYGDKVMDEIFVRNILFSHKYPFRMFRAMWVTR